MNDYLKRLASDTFAIFLFHGVHADNQDWKVRNYNQKHIPKWWFREIIQALKENGTPISMADVVNIHNGEEPLPERSFAITFDDGFENTYWLAAPILEEFHVPATWYITTGFVDGNPSGSWIDRIEASAEKHSSLSERQLADLRSFAKDVPGLDPYELADFLLERLGFAKLDDPQLDAKLTWPQIRDLCRNRLFTIGGHTVTHPRLEFLPTDEAVREVKCCIESFKQSMSLIIQHFSYPEGLPGCEAVADIMKENGILCCPTAQDGVNTVSTDLYELRRIMVI